jgi:mono/diheme cytochrome c family protein
MRRPILVLLLLVVLAPVACRGGVSSQPPVHPVLDMDFQPKLRAQAESRFEGWADGRAMREPVPGTIPHDPPRDPRLLAFQNTDGSFASNPLPLTAAVMQRGRERYDIHCAPCHDRVGTGNGLVARRWPVKIPSFLTDERVSKLPDGEIFQTITNGKGTMPSYAHQVKVEDRWAIVHYIRALQDRSKQ